MLQEMDFLNRHVKIEDLINHGRGTFTGQGKVVNSRQVGRRTILTLDIVYQYQGFLEGTLAYKYQLEQVIVRGTQGRYFLLGSFEGQVDGSDCRVLIRDSGEVDLGADPPNWEGHWVIESSSCNIVGLGSITGNIHFTSDTEFNVDGTYTAKIGDLPVS